jgi:hypothetical protein
MISPPRKHIDIKDEMAIVPTIRWQIDFIAKDYKENGTG